MPAKLYAHHGSPSAAFPRTQRDELSRIARLIVPIQLTAQVRQRDHAAGIPGLMPPTVTE